MADGLDPKLITDFEGVPNKKCITASAKNRARSAETSPYCLRFSRNSIPTVPRRNESSKILHLRLLKYTLSLMSAILNVR